MQAVDFFCGSGGVTCGFKLAGIDVIGGVDFDAACRETYEQNNNALFLNSDISTLDPEALQDVFQLQTNQDDMIFIGCSPCQYYSNINTTRIKSTVSRFLLDDFQRFVEYFTPGFIFLENVPGFSKKEESPLRRFLGMLDRLGYRYDSDVINAKNYDVPQSRRRFVLIATRLDADNIQLQIPRREDIRIPTVREAIGNYDKFKPIDHGVIDVSDFQHSTARLSPINLKRMRRTSHNGGDRREWQNDPELQLECYKKHNGHWDVYGRMYWDRPSPTITTRFCSVSNGRYGHPEQDRAISLREGAALQSFPHDYRFIAKGQGAIAKMIGNAVPPNLARHIGNTINTYYDIWQNLRQEQEL